MFDHLPATIVALDATSSFGAVAGRLLLGTVVGAATAVVMVTPIWRQDDGLTPVYATAVVARRTMSDEVNLGGANIAHHTAGALTDVLYVVAYLVTNAIASDLGVASIGVDLPSHLIATMVVVVLIYVVFAQFIFPRAGQHIYGEYTTAVRGQWPHSSPVSGATLLVLTPAIFPGFVQWRLGRKPGRRTAVYAPQPNRIVLVRDLSRSIHGETAPPPR